MSIPDNSASDFIRNIISNDINSGKFDSSIITRFPPEPNGYLHIGHAKSICLNFGVANEYGGICHLRFDDTNPTREDVEYVESIKTDVKWLGYDWQDHLYFASDYFDQLYDFAVVLIEKGLAYVDSLSADDIRRYRGTLTEPGQDSPYRDRSIEDNLALFEQMKKGQFEDGTHVLRAKIDMASPNLNLRDPTLYRIRKMPHHRTGDIWKIYPMYDFAHSLSDSIEGVTHSLCTLEFEDHRPLYDWFLDVLQVHRSQQIEFARLNLSNTVMSKRMLRDLVENRHVSGWDDPRMPTISGLRRRGYTPEAIRMFCHEIGIAKRDTEVESALLEHCLRTNLNLTAPRVMGVIDPVKVVLINYPEDLVEEFDAVNNPEDLSMGTRKVPFSRELFIEREDFMETPSSKFFRLAPGKEVRLRAAYYITCVDVIKNVDGLITEIHCTYDPDSRGGSSLDGRRVRGTLHWVSAKHAIKAEIRLYGDLFVDTTDGDNGGLLTDRLNPHSLTVMTECYVEPSLAESSQGVTYQFERQGYFCLDSVDSTPGQLVFNRTVSLRDSWSKVNKS
ncbi:MAG: glutamine--tRNA ligase [Dehalococcoidia bacterium]|nr:glutamine--tRNA ligase [Dehalococcoidia bacterium]|tara:strand:- start:13387 stop:15063 length:1677 start_codon:yes stop_codon:yes gene_type:complete